LIPADTLGRATTAAGNEIALYHRADVYQIRFDGFDLMSSRAHASAEALARLGCLALPETHAPRLLIGGLGMGYTVRAALDSLPASASVIVAEVFAAVIEWNRGPLAHLARRPLDDPRVVVVQADVTTILETSAEPFDAILLDVDNGPSVLTLASNRDLYYAAGLALIRRRLTPDGILAVWCAYTEPAFVRRLRRAAYTVRTATVPARAGERRAMDRIVLARPHL
jgi:spermidine synthase